MPHQAGGRPDVRPCRPAAPVRIGIFRGSGAQARYLRNQRDEINGTGESAAFPDAQIQSSQFSNFKPGTWAKSTVLRVRSGASWTRTMLATFRWLVSSTSTARSVAHALPPSLAEFVCFAGKGIVLPGPDSSEPIFRGHIVRTKDLRHLLFESRNALLNRQILRRGSGIHFQKNNTSPLELKSIFGSWHHQDFRGTGKSP